MLKSKENLFKLNDMLDDFISNNPFWQFSLNLYKDEPVKYACLYLQNTQKININVVLFLLWLAKTTRGAVSETQLTQISERIDYWHRAITIPLRQMKSKSIFQTEPYRPLHQSILETELFSSQLEQAILYEYGSQIIKNASESKQQLSDAVKSLKVFSHFYQFIWPEVSRQQLVKLLSQLFDDVEVAFIDKVVDAYLIRKTPYLKSRLSERQSYSR